MTASHTYLASPGQIGRLTLRNRMVVAAMGVSLAEEDGSAGEQLIAYHEAQAAGGVGLIICGVSGVAWPVGAVTWRQTAISADRFLPGLTHLCERVHAHGARIAAQLHHGGLVAGYSSRWDHPLWAPSVPPPPAGNFLSSFLPEEMTAFAGMKPPQLKLLTPQDIAHVVGQFGDAADRARRAGFDAVEIHAGHGYLLSSFISPKTNTRTDEYGGSIDNRLRILREVLAEVRRRVGPDFPIIVKLDSREVGKDGGITLDDAILAASQAQAAGADAISVSAYHETGKGELHSESNIPHIEDFNLPATAAIRAAINIPVLAAGRIELDSAERALQSGQADFISMGRKLLADPALPTKVCRGDAARIRPCIYCYTCVSAIYAGSHVRCAVNTDLAFEHEGDLPATTDRRHVVVVGAGPGGMETARLLAGQGHRVTLLERSRLMGGTLRFAALAYEPNGRLLDWLQARVAEARIDVRLGVEATPALLSDLKPDAVIVATGARRAMPDLPGSDLPHVLSGDDLRGLLLGDHGEDIARKTGLLTRLLTKVGAATGLSTDPARARLASRAWMPLGQRIVVIGGELVGLELAEFLAERGRTVTVVDEAPVLGRGLTVVRRMRIVPELAHHGVTLCKGVKDIAITADAVRFLLKDQLQVVPADQVIVARGATGDSTLADALAAAGCKVQLIGDAGGVGYIEGAMRGARAAVRQLAGL